MHNFTYRPKVYTASRIDRWRLWRTLAEDPDWAFCEFTARWIYWAHLETGSNEPITPDQFANFWTCDIQDIKRSDFVLLYGRETGLRGALIEAGIALGCGIRTVVVGLPEEHSWAHHPLITNVATLEEAKAYLYKFTIMVPPTRKGASSAKTDPSDD